MWSQSAPYHVPTKPITLEPQKILYFFDGPQIFSAQFGFLDAMFVKIDDGEDSYIFLANTTTDEIVSLVERNKLSVRGAFLHAKAWVVETDLNYKITKYWSISKDEIHEWMLPKAGVALQMNSPRVPDSVEQATAFFSIAFRGAQVSRGKMPFSSLKGLVDNAYNLAKRVLTPQPLRGSRSTTFDLIVEPTIGSLIISIDSPKIQIDRINKRLEAELSVEQLRSVIAGQRDDFLEAFSTMVDNPTSQGASAETARDFVFQYRDLIPTEDSSYASVEFSAKVGNEIRTVFIDTDTGSKINKFFDENTSERVSRSGKIVEINMNSGTFLLSTRSGRVTTCILNGDAFGDPMLRIGNHAELTGQLYRRPRRDKLYVGTYLFSGHK